MSYRTHCGALGVNPSAYCGNNPVMSADPTAHDVPRQSEKRDLVPW